MKSIKINTVIDDNNIKFKELEGYQGKKAEIIINFKEDDEAEERIIVAGALNEYANISKHSMEKKIWERIAKNRHGLH